MPDYLPHVIALPFVLTLVIIVAATLLSLRHLRPAAGVAFAVALIVGWREARKISDADSTAGLAVLPAGFSTLSWFLIGFALIAGLLWAVQTMRSRKLGVGVKRAVDPDDRKSHLR